MQANRDAFEEVGFVPKMAVPGLDDLAVARPRRCSAHEVALPVVLAPVGFTRAMAPGR